MTNKTWKKYCALIQGKRWTKQDINGFMKALNSMRFTSNMERKDRIGDLLLRFENGPREYSITREQTTQGIDYLRRRYFKLNGDARKSCPFSLPQQWIIKNFVKFKFVAVLVERNAWGQELYMPVYRVYAKGGLFFDYTPVHWGIPIIHGNSVAPHPKRNEGAALYLVAGGKS